MTVERAHRILGQGYTREEARRLMVVCGFLLDAAESALDASAVPSASPAREPFHRFAPVALVPSAAGAAGVPNPCEP